MRFGEPSLKLKQFHRPEIVATLRQDPVVTLRGDQALRPFNLGVAKLLGRPFYSVTGRPSERLKSHA
jgi:hypothetical protein